MSNPHPVASWKKGESGNDGRRKVKIFRDQLLLAIHEEIREVRLAGPNPKKAIRIIAEKLRDMAMEGNVDAIAMIADRLDGKAAVTANITTNFPLVSQDIEPPQGVVIEGRAVRSVVDIDQDIAAPIGEMMQ